MIIQCYTNLAVFCFAGQILTFLGCTFHFLGSREEKLLQKEYRRHMVKLKSLSPSPSHVKKGSKSRRESKRNSVEGHGTGVISGMMVPGCNESYERLFNPSWGTVRSKQGICAALAYLVQQFLELKQSPKGIFKDGARFSLRLAVSSLARHHAFDEMEKVEAVSCRLFQEEDEENRWTKAGQHSFPQNNPGAKAHGEATSRASHSQRVSLSQDHLSSTFRGWALKLLDRGMRKKNASLKDGWATMVGGR